MKLILSYTGNASDGKVIQPVLPIEAESSESARLHFRLLAVAAFHSNARTFSAFGWAFLTFNFFKRVSDRQVDHMNLRLQHVGRPPMETFMDTYGNVYCWKGLSIQTFDEWFDKTHAKRDAEDFEEPAQMAG